MFSLKTVDIVFVIAFGCISLANGHTMGLGSCPKVEPMKDFNMDKFMGEWFVIQKFATSSSCMKYNFSKGSDGKMRLVQTRQHFVLDSVGVDHIYTYTGVLTVPDEERPSRMRVKFPLNIAGEADFVVYTTDYDSYAGIFTCQKILFGHTRSATILSRKSTLDSSVIHDLRQRLSDEGVDPEDFSVVDQGTCIKQADASFNVKIDDKTFKAGNVASTVAKVRGVIGSGLEKAGDVLGAGVSKASNVTGDFVEKIKSKVSSSSKKQGDLDDLLNNSNTEDNAAEFLP